MENEKVVMEVVDFDQLRALKDKVRSGAEFPAMFGASYIGDVEGVKCVCLVGETHSGFLELHVAISYLDDVLELADDPSCVFEFAGYRFIVSEQGASIWRGEVKCKFVKFVADHDMSLMFQKTQYRASNPFNLPRIALDPLWRHWFAASLGIFGWLKWGERCHE